MRQRYPVRRGSTEGGGGGSWETQSKMSQAWIATISSFHGIFFTHQRTYSDPFLRAASIYWVGVVGNYCLHGLCGRRDAEEVATVGRAAD